MDLFNVRAIEVSKLAMDGLVKRQTAIASNTANAMTPEYQRKQDTSGKTDFLNMDMQDFVTEAERRRTARLSWMKIQ